MSAAQGYMLTAEQQIRLAVFQGLVGTDFYATTNDLAEAIKSVSAAIIGVDEQEAMATEGAQVIYEGVVLTDIPEWAEYVAGDSDGEIYLYEFEPEMSVSRQVWAHVKGDLLKLWAKLPLETKAYPLQKLAPRK